jgi:ABC-type Fe3+ transport system substrate-binding protein
MSGRSTRRHFLRLTLLTWGGGVLAACSPTVPTQPTLAPTSPPSTPATTAGTAATTTSAAWDKIVDAARQEGSVSLVLNVGDGPMKMVSQFQSRYPWLKIESQGLLAVDFTPRMISEQRNGLFAYDVAAGSFINTIGSNWAPANAVQSIKPFLDDLPADVRDDTKWAGGFERYRTADTTDSFVNQLNVSGGVWVNREQIPASEFSSAKQLLDPKFKGKIALVDLTRVGGGTSVMTGIVRVEGEDFVRRFLAEQAPAIQDNQGLVNQWLVTGQYPIAVGAALAGIRDFQSKGVGTSCELTREPQYNYLGPAGVAVLTRAPHPNATRLFLAWLLSQEGQDQWSQLSTPDATTRRLDVTVYHPDTTPDWSRLSEYVLLGGTPEFAAIQDRIIAIASGKA